MSTPFLVIFVLVLVLAFYGGIGRIVWGMFRSERDSKEGRG